MSTVHGHSDLRVIGRRSGRRFEGGQVVCRIRDGFERESPPLGSRCRLLDHTMEPTDFFDVGLEDLHPHAQSYCLRDRAVIQHVGLFHPASTCDLLT